MLGQALATCVGKTHPTGKAIIPTILPLFFFFFPMHCLPPRRWIANSCHGLAAARVGRLPISQPAGLRTMNKSGPSLHPSFLLLPVTVRSHHVQSSRLPHPRSSRLDGERPRLARPKSHARQPRRSPGLDAQAHRGTLPGWPAEANKRPSAAAKAPAVCPAGHACFPMWIYCRRSA